MTNQISKAREDLLRMDFINSLPQLFARTLGKDSIWWPVYDFDVQTGLMRLDVMGKLDITHIGDIGMFRDEEGKEYETKVFYSDYQEPARTLHGIIGEKI